MRNIGIILVIFLALVLGTAASVMAYYYLKSRPQKEVLELAPVVVANQDLTFGEVLASENMRVVMYPAASIPAGAHSSLDSLDGQITKVFLKENEAILDSKLSSSGGGISLLIEKSMRAASIKVDKVSGVSGFILPGDLVDVILTVDNYGRNREAVAKTILQKVEVLAAGEKTEQKGDKVITVQAVTLMVDLEGAQALALATQKGKLHLALRNPTDIDTTATGRTNTTELVKDKPKPQPEVKTKIVYRDRPVPVKDEKDELDSMVVIRGQNKKTELPAMSEEKEKAEQKN